MQTRLEKAVIMCAGEGTRMRPITTPKPLIEKDGKAIVDYMMEHLSSQGIKQFILTTRYRPELFEERYAKTSNVRLIPEDDLMARDIGEDFLLVTGDILFKLDVQDMYRHHKEQEKDVTVLVKSVQIPGGVINGEEWREKPKFNIGVGAFIINANRAQTLVDTGVNIPETMKTTTKCIYPLQGNYVHLTSIEDYVKWIWKEVPR